MELTLSERLAVVETKVDTLQEGWTSMDGKLQTVCDYILAQKARKSFVRSTLGAVGGVIAAAGVLWELIPKR